MLYEELHRRYGNHIAKRVRQELTAPEFAHISLKELLPYAEMRAETAHKEYAARLNNPFNHEELRDAPEDYMDLLYRRWCEAEDLAYLLAVAEDVGANARVTVEN